MNNFSFEFTPTESSAGGTLLYVTNHLSYKPCLDLNIYKSTEIESTFIEILKPKKSNILLMSSLILLPLILLFHIFCNQLD